jgi:CRISPR-associated protein Csx10
MKIIHYQITLDEPALFTSFAGDPNTLVSYDYIPGSVLRGMLIAMILRKEGGDFSLDAARDEDRRLFFSGETRYLNAYPLINGERSLPVPATWQGYKYQAPDTIFDTAFGRQFENQKPKSISGFVVRKDKEAYVTKPNHIINVHSQRGRYTGRQRDENTVEQAVFRYDALAAGQSFGGVILCNHDVDAELLATLLNDAGQISIGGARTAGYGLCQIHDVSIEDNWNEAEGNGEKPLLLTLLSDLILRDSEANYTPSPQLLRQSLRELSIDCEITPKSMTITMIGGFNRKWGLPLPQIPAITAGSVFEISNLAANEAALQGLIWYGLGERILDGYGRLALAWQEYEALDLLKWSYQEEVIAAKPELSELSQRLWSGDKKRTGLLQRIREQQIDKQVVGIVYDNKYRIRGPFNRSQIARLRLVIANELRKPSPTKAVLKSYLNDIKGKVAGRQLDETRIGRERLSQWLENPDFGDDVSGNIQKQDAYLLQLVDAALERAYKEKTLEEG